MKLYCPPFWFDVKKIDRRFCATILFTFLFCTNFFILRLSSVKYAKKKRIDKKLSMKHNAALFLKKCIYTFNVRIDKFGMLQ